MSRQLEQALLSLMPSQADILPPQLVHLAESLLAQSRQKASTLKADEDVARLYACAHIACDRLKIPLDLPPIAPRPPIPPRNYKRLYDYLERILPSTSSTPKRGTPRRRTPGSKAAGLDAEAGEERALPSRGTPSKEQTLASWRTPSKTTGATPTKSAGRRSSRIVNAELLPWIRPVTRFICTETENTKLSPTIVAGLEATMLPAGRRAADEWVHENTTALFAAIYFYVTMKVRSLTSGLEVDRDAYMPLRKNILSLLDRARQEVEIKGLDEDLAWAGWTTVKPKEFDDALSKTKERGWLDSDWYRGIADIVAPSSVDDVLMLEDEDAGMAQTGQVRRADTMFQDRFDYLSDTRRAEYKIWKATTLERIVQVMESQNAMEVDPA
ncbi:origin recognition complex subunit 6 (ORC6) domain-containing protein [Sarocladium implicatum]|nr:origin recognition complex subunit 6 (ORC6) domain-containing protein [Sarocladium implicatum]